MKTLDQYRQHFQGCKPKEFIEHKSKVHTLAWNANGTKLATGSTDHSIRLWSLERLSSSSSSSSSISSERRGHEGAVEQVAWSPIDNDIFASASTDKSVRLWDAKLPTALRSWSLGVETINLAWHPNGNLLAVGSKDDSLTIIDIRQDGPMTQMKFSMEINEMAWSPSGDHLIVTTGLGTIEVVQFHDGTLTVTKSLPAHTSNCYCIDFNRSTGDCFAVGSADAVVSIWDFEAMACSRTICRLDWPVRSVSFSHDGGLLASASEDTNIDIAYVATGESVCQVPVNAPVNCVAWNPQKYLLAFAGENVDSRTGRSNGSIKIFGFSS